MELARCRPRLEKRAKKEAGARLFAVIVYSSAKNRFETVFRRKKRWPRRIADGGAAKERLGDGGKAKRRLADGGKAKERLGGPSLWRRLSSLRPETTPSWSALP
jgi:hypothetical protein